MNILNNGDLSLEKNSRIICYSYSHTHSTLKVHSARSCKNFI